nr:CRISPR-associated endoribonuclease Cas6 [Clostridium cochlearium]
MEHKCLKFKEGILKVNEIYSKKQLNKERIAVLTISPVVVVKPIRKSRMEFYNPKDNEFLNSIKNNIIAKYNSFYNEEYKGIMNISILDENNIRKK